MSLGSSGRSFFAPLFPMSRRPPPEQPRYSRIRLEGIDCAQGVRVWLPRCFSQVPSRPWRRYRDDAAPEHRASICAVALAGLTHPLATPISMAADVLLAKGPNRFSSAQPRACNSNKTREQQRARTALVRLGNRRAKDGLLAGGIRGTLVCVQGRRRRSYAGLSERRPAPCRSQERFAGKDPKKRSPRRSNLRNETAGF